MKLNKTFLKELQNRLKVGNKRGVHLNAVPGRSRFKLDLKRLSCVKENLPIEFVNKLLSEVNLKFEINWKNKQLDINELNEDQLILQDKLNKSFENLFNQTQAIESEKGINTFGFGYPLVIRKDKADNKLTVAPLLIWSLKIKRGKAYKSWIIERNAEEPIYLNEVLINHLQNDVKISIDKIDIEMLEDGLIDKEELIEISVKLIEKINTSESDNLEVVLRRKIEKVNEIKSKKYYDNSLKINSDSLLEFGGIFSIFEVQKQSIINNYDDLLKLEGVEIDNSDIEKHHFQPLSAIDTDPTQQGILNAINTKKNLIIQGPPGTGKSQTLTAILVNALENNKKTIVVCEKKAALDVLQNAMEQKGLRQHCILIKDTVKDRRLVVNSVRNRTDKTIRTRRVASQKITLNKLVDQSNKLIKSINNKHKYIDQQLVETNNWTQTVGLFLKENKKNIPNSQNIEIDNKLLYNFNKNEYDELCTIVEEAQQLYMEYKPKKHHSFIKTEKFTGDNPFKLHQQLEKDFKSYRHLFTGQQSDINILRNKYKNNPDFFDLEKTNNWKYKLLALFSTEKKQLLNDQLNLFSKCHELVTIIENDGWINISKLNRTSQSIILEIETKLSKQSKYPADFFETEFNWFTFYYNLNNSQKTLIDKLKNTKDWVTEFKCHYLNAILTENATTKLPNNNTEHEKLQDSLSKIKEKQLKFINNYWQEHQNKCKANFNSSNTIKVANLYNKKASKNHKRNSLRKICEYDIDLFTAFFPIILTTPNVCCTLFKNKNEYFDIVMFDEASQLRIEDTLPCLLKGKQVIVAGDEHQMPPSNYFSKIYDGEIENEDEIEEETNETEMLNESLLSCESLLDFSVQFDFQKRFLEFHYRSKHPDLIEFSNHAFYNKRLKPLPNFTNYTPIKLVEVNGTYCEGTNDGEAQKILSILDNDITQTSKGKYPSIGVATFNIAQRNLILEKLLERKKSDPNSAFSKKMIELEENGFFVKNLENIQGDERDIIILSTTYGKDKDGNFRQRFGPINHKKGYKLLNVIITRAKCGIYVCTSIPSEYYLNYNTYLTAEKVNNRRAVFYAYLAYAKAVSDNNNELKEAVFNALEQNNTKNTTSYSYIEELESPFEEEVYQALIENVEEHKLTPQLKYGGFRIDIVYDPQIKGVPKIAIECDGATYHQSQEAYLYDLHRQKILESHGFVFHRIWSKNWWINSKRETEKLVNFIKTVEGSNNKIAQQSLKKTVITPNNSKVTKQTNLFD